MSLPITMAMITISDAYGINYCVECADDRPDIREKIENALRQGTLTIDEPAGGEVCEGCGRRIRQIPAYRRTYLMRPKLEITTTLEVPAHSAVEALLTLDEAIDEDAITNSVRGKIEDLLEEGKMADPELTYTVDEPKMKPPPDFRSLAPSLGISTTPAPQRMPYPQTTYPSLAQIEALIALYGETALRTAYPSNQAACALLHFILTHNEMRPRFFQGYLINHQDEGRAYPHTWLEILTHVGPRLIDYGARQLWKDETIPSGLFAVGDYPHLVYLGNSALLPSMPESLQKDVLAVIEKALAEQAAHTFS